MPNESVRAADLVLRCYARRTGRDRDRWVAHCVDLDLWATGKSLDEAKASMDDAIVGYLLTVLDTHDEGSIPRLLKRKASLRYRLFWRLLSLLDWMNGSGPLNSQSFEEHLPFRLAIA